MTDLTTTTQHLAEAERHVRDAERRYDEQIVRIKAMFEDGHEVQDHVELLATFKATLELMYDHRNILRAELAAAEGWVARLC